MPVPVAAPVGPGRGGASARRTRRRRGGLDGAAALPAGHGPQRGAVWVPVCGGGALRPGGGCIALCGGAGHAALCRAGLGCPARRGCAPQRRLPVRPARLAAPAAAGQTAWPPGPCRGRGARRSSGCHARRLRCAAGKLPCTQPQQAPPGFRPGGGRPWGWWAKNCFFARPYSKSAIKSIVAGVALGRWSAQGRLPRGRWRRFGPQAVGSGRSPAPQAGGYLGAASAAKYRQAPPSAARCGKPTPGARALSPQVRGMVGKKPVLRTSLFKVSYQK